MKKYRPYLLVALLLSCLTTVAQKKAQKESPTDPSPEVNALLVKHGCSSCHHSARRMVGPSFTDIAKKNYLAETIVEKIGQPQPAAWPGYPPMPALAIPNEEALKIAAWINSIIPAGDSETAKLR